MKETGIQFSLLGSYRNNSLFTTLPPEADIRTLETGSPLDTEACEKNIGLNIHEYIHQLHNFSTTSGLQLLKNRLAALQIFATGTDDNGHYIRQGKIYKHLNKNILENFEKDYSRILGNTDKIDKWGNLSEFSFETTCYQEETDDSSDPCTIIGVDAKFKLNGVEREAKIQNIGYNIITEGIAYEIERQVRNSITGKSGIELELATPPLPYRFYRPIVEHFVGRECSVPELVKVGILALQNKIPSLGLFAAASALREGGSVYSEFISNTINEHNIVLAGYKATIAELHEKALAGTTLKDGLILLDEIVMSAMNKREKDPFYELLFLRETMTPEVFTHILRTEELPPRCILQYKHDETAELYFIGQGVSDYSDTRVGAISTLQCALQFSTLHIAPNGSFNNTVRLQESPNKLACPYLDACPLKDKRENQNLCSEAPWMHDLGIQTGDVCWYVNGVKSLRNLKFGDYDEQYV
ncbi:hypothetical protein ACP3VQ_17485 [Metapseudomonas otitidis]|uniref:hypothetical protein n=1 Tax=Metapseudomonas otitidis TaxID=319939 RepID=UPI003CEA44A5